LRAAIGGRLAILVEVVPIGMASLVRVASLRPQAPPQQLTCASKSLAIVL
jgi:hypothetical protein